MKIGIVTFHWSKNYGAALQAYALRTKLSQILECDIEIINYKPSYPKKKKSIEIKIKEFILACLLIPEKRNRKRLLDRFKQFEIEYMNTTKKEYICISEFTDINIDIIISGSDQLWNPNLTGGILNPVYFCNFSSKYCQKKIAYAASIGERHVREEHEKLFKQYLNNFNKILVRESSLIEELSKYTKKNIEHVLDPTLLLNIEDYKKIAVIPKKTEKYLLIYQNSINPIIFKVARKIAKQKKLKIIEIVYNRHIPPRSHSEIRDAGPREFLGWFINADYVVTNTFHGTVFSILCEKNFTSIPLKGRESRVMSLVQILHLEDRIVNTITDHINSNDIDYNQVYKYLERERELSLNFIKNAINLDQ